MQRRLKTIENDGVWDFSFAFGKHLSSDRWATLAQAEPRDSEEGVKTQNCEDWEDLGSITEIEEASHDKIALPVLDKQRLPAGSVPVVHELGGPGALQAHVHAAECQA